MIKAFINKFRNASVEVKATLSYTVCNVVQRCMSFITLPLFARILTEAENGKTHYFQSVEAIVTIFISLNLAYGSFNRAMVKFEDRRDEYISSINGIVAILGSILLAIYLPFKDFFNGILKLPTILVIFMIAHIIFSHAIACWQAKKRFEYNYKKIIAQMLTLIICAPILSFIFINVFEDRGVGKVIGGILASVVLGGVIFVQSFIKGKKFFNKEFWKYALGFNIPLIPYYLSQVIFNQSDKIMIENMLGETEVGLYGTAYNLALILVFVLNAINNSYLPWLYDKLKNGGTKKNQKISTGIAGLMAVLLLFIIIVAPEVIYIMAGKRYAGAVWVVPPVAMSLLFQFLTQLFVNVEFYYEEKKGLVFGTIFAALANIGLNYLLIPVYGYVAAAYTTLISYIIFAVMNFLSYKRILKKHKREDDLYNYKALIGITVAFLVAGFGFMMLYEFIIVRYVIVLIGLVMAIIFRKKLMGIYTKFKNRNNKS